MSFFRKYSIYNNIGSVTENKASDGVTIMVNKSVPHSEVWLKTKLQAIAIRASIPKPLQYVQLYTYLQACIRKINILRN